METFLRRGERNPKYWARLSEALMVGGEHQQAEDIWFKDERMDRATRSYEIAKSLSIMGHHVTLGFVGDWLLRSLSEAEQRPIRLYVAVVDAGSPHADWRSRLPRDSRGLTRDLPLALATAFCLYRAGELEPLKSTLTEFVVPREPLIPSALKAEMLPILAAAGLHDVAEKWYWALTTSKIPLVRYRLAEYLRLSKAYDRAIQELSGALQRCKTPFLKRRIHLSSLALVGPHANRRMDSERQLRKLLLEDPEDSIAIWNYQRLFGKRFLNRILFAVGCALSSLKGALHLARRL